jgi:hypothetical protein
MVSSQFAVFIASVIGIVPPLAFMMFMLSPHEEQFGDRDVFFSFAYGFIVGGVLAIIQWAIIADYIINIEKVSPISTLIVGAMMALVITLIIIFWSNRKKFFHTDTARFIGLAVGCGISTSFIFAKIYADLQKPFQNEGDNFNFYLKNGLYILSVLLMNTAAGIAAGNEITKGMYKLGVLKCTLLLLLFYPLMIFHMVFFDNDQQWGYLAVLTLIGALAFLYQYTKNVNKDEIPFLKGSGEKETKRGKKKEEKGKGSRRTRRRK